MSKKKQGSNLGRAIIKDRFGGNYRVKSGDSHLHTSELNDGYEWGRLNLQSVTEQSNLDDFLATAELAGTEFTAEKLNVKIVDPSTHSGLLTQDEEKHVKEAQEKHKQFLTIPRRPVWDETTTADQLDQMERDSFLTWRKQLAELQDVEGIILTPFEKNLQFWRQLWRVIERSDIVVQIVDGRNPTLFRCPDMEEYVKQSGDNKMNLVLINKADHLSEEQRKMWAEYYDNAGLRVAFWSAMDEAEKLKEQDDSDSGNDEDKMDDEADDDSDDSSTDKPHDIDNQSEPSQPSTMDQSETTTTSTENEQISQNLSPMELITENVENNSNQDISQDALFQTGSAAMLDSNRTAENESCDTCGGNAPSVTMETMDDNRITEELDSNRLESEDDVQTVRNNPELLSGDELIEFFKTLHTGKKYTEGVTTVGMVGYPNVGKSSTINAILQTKKVPVSATPGRTKHFQTLYVDPTILLCDCPGLVMPMFVSTKAHMITNGILPIDHMRDYVPPVSLVCKQIPRTMLEATYGILLPKPLEGEDPSRPPTAHELLTVYACMRGYMTHKGVPDFQRSARCILKDYVNGKLLYCNPPPGVSDDQFHPNPDMKPEKLEKRDKLLTRKYGDKDLEPDTQCNDDVDKAFFSKTEVKVGSKGVHGVVGYARKDYAGHHTTGEGSSESGSLHGSLQSLQGKPWKKHHNKGKKEKLRRLTGHRDEKN